VVAIGESAHHVRKLYLWRHRLLRLLAERCGFTVFAMESGFSEGLAVDDWVRGGPGDLAEPAEHGITYRCPKCATAQAGRTSTRRADPDAPGGVAVTSEDLPPAPADSVEAAFLPSAGPVLVDLRAARDRMSGPGRIRVSKTFLDTPVLDAYDLVVSIPEITTTSR
jgi:erythromycin esterase